MKMGRSEEEFLKSSTGKVLRMIDFWYDGIPQQKQAKKITTVHSMKDFLRG